VDPRDARRAVVELTSAGREFLHSAHATRRDAVETALAGFSETERQEFAALLDRFVAAWPRQNASSDG
jgi:DNA-binding MarR family transcriptional regulator